MTDAITFVADGSSPPVPSALLDAAAEALVRRHLMVGDVIDTLARPSPNWLLAVDRTGLLVHTEKSRREGAGPQLVEPRMLQLAWDVLRAEGQLTNRRLLHDLRVHRSSFVCAALARLPGVEVVARSPIKLRWTGDRVGLAAENGEGYEP